MRASFGIFDTEIVYVLFVSYCIKTLVSLIESHSFHVDLWFGQIII